MKFNSLLLSFILISMSVIAQEMPDVKQGDNFYEFNQKFYQLNPIDTVFEGGIFGNMYKTSLIWSPRLSPSGYVEPAAQAIINYSQSYDFELLETYDVNWTSMGPTGLAESSSNNDKTNGVGQIQRIAFDPFYDGDTNQVVYATSSFGGLWRSDDNGGEWYLLNTDLQLPITSVADVVICPNSSDTIFIGTGDNDGGVGLRYGPNAGSIDPIFTCGVFRSTNYGQDWEPINTNLLQYFSGGGTIRKMTINPYNGNQILFAASNGIYRTNNPLSSSPDWTKVFSGVDSSFNEDFRGIEFKPLSDSIIYASGLDVYKSNDNGDSWVSMSGPLTGLNLDSFPYNFKVRRINIATTEADSSRLYAYINGSEFQIKANGDTVNGSRLYIYLYQSDSWDSLFTFKDYDTVLNEHDYYIDPFLAVSPTWMPIAVSPVDADRLVFGHTKVWGTIDIQTFSPTEYSTKERHADIHALEFQPVNDNPGIFCGTDGGVSFKDESNYNITTGWSNKVDGLSVNTTWTFDVSEVNENVIVIGNQDCGGFLRTQTGNNWMIYHGGDGYGARIHPIYLGYTFYKTNGGSFMNEYNYFERHGIPISAPIDYGSRDLAVAPNTFSVQENYNDRTLEFGLTELYDMKTATYTTNEETWEVDSDLYKSYSPEQQNQRWRRQITEIAMSPSNPDIIYLVTLGAYNGPDAPWQLPSRLYKSTNGGNNGNLNIDSFDTINFPGDSLNPFPVITGIAVNPSNANNIFLSFSGYMEQYKVWSSNDGGTTWTNEDPLNSLNNLPVNGVEYYKGNTEDFLFIPTDAGVFFKSTTDTNWIKYGDIPNVRVTELKVLQNKKRIYASTFGRGIWKASLPDDCSEFDTIPIVISNDTVFNSSATINKSTIIESGATLTISCNLFFFDESKITVKRGAKLILDKANLTTACDYETWKGIELWGTSDSSQYCEECQGSFVAKNSSINFAELGILTARINSVGFIDEDYSGGIIKMDTSTFFSCNVILRQLNYENFDPETGEPLANTSYFNKVHFNGSPRLDSVNYTGALVELYDVSGIEFKECVFSSEYFFLSPSGEKNQSLVYLQAADDIDFIGCKFQNLLNSEYGDNTNFQEERGIGIFSYNAEFYVDELSEQAEPISLSKFHDLYYGIKVLGVNTEVAPYITNTVFDSVYRGVYLSGISYPVITNNEIRLADSPSLFESPSYGIYLDNCNHYIVQENLIWPYNTDLSEVGMVVNNSGEDNNLINNNQFQRLFAGVICQDYNRARDGSKGLFVKCNEFTFCKYDIAVTMTGADARYKGIKDAQGSDESVSSPGGNEFTVNAVSILNYDNESENHITYFAHDPSSSTYVVPQNYTEENITIDTTAHLFTYNLACPPIEINRGTDSSKLLLNENRSMLAQVEEQLDTNTDGGNTDELAGDVVYSVPPEAMDVYDELMAESPYLSDTVMIEIARKENVLNAAMTRDVMVANPQSAKKKDVMEELNNRVDQIPENMMAEIKGGKTTVEQKELLEAEHGDLLMNIASNLSSIIRSYRNDTTDRSDSLYALYASGDNLNLKYEYVFNLLKEKDTIKAQQVIDSIPIWFEFDAFQQANHQNFENYIDIYKGCFVNSNLIDSSSKAELRNISSLLYDLSAGYARNILMAEDTLSYNEPIILPAVQNKSEIISDNNKTNKGIFYTADQYMQLFPNPASDYVVVDYDLSAERNVKATLELLTVDGKFVSLIHLKGNKNHQIIDLRNVQSGKYIVKLRNNDELMEAEKLVINK